MLKRNIKFPIVMSSGVQVRTLEELKNNFELEIMIDYYFDGRLKTWLDQRYYTVEAQMIEDLTTEKNANIPEKLCHIFGVKDHQFNFEEFMKRKDKLSKVKQYIGDSTILDRLDLIAMSQTELEQIIHECKNISARTIYLLGESFEVGDTVDQIKYIGINKPLIKLVGAQNFDAKSKNINFENVILTAENQVRLKPSSGSAFDADDTKIKQGVVIKKHTKTIKINKNQFKGDYFSIFVSALPSPENIHIYNNVLCVRIGEFLAFYDIDNNRLINKIETSAHLQQHVKTIRHEDSVYCLDVTSHDIDETNGCWYKVFKVDLKDPTKREEIYFSFRFEGVSTLEIKDHVLKLYGVSSNVNDSDNFKVIANSIELKNKRISNNERIEKSFVGSRYYFGGVPSYCYMGILYYFLPKERKLYNSMTESSLLSFSGTIGEFVIGQDKIFARSSYSKSDGVRTGVSPDSLVAMGDIIVFDLKTGKQLGHLKTHNHDVSYMKISNDVLITWSGYEELKLWDIGTLELMNTFKIKYDGSWNLNSFDIDLCDDKLAVMCEDSVLIYE